MRWLRALVVIGITILAASGSALGLPPVMTDVPIEGTDLTIGNPDGWNLRPKQQSPEELRALVSAFPAFAAQVGLHASDSDARLVQTWKRMSEAFVHVAFDPRDNDTVTVAIFTGAFWPNFTAWRNFERATARRYPGKVLSIDETSVGTHRAFTSIIKTDKFGLLSVTMVIEQSDGRYVIVSTTLDHEDRELAEQVLGSVKAA